MKKDYIKIILATLTLIFGLLALFYGVKYYQENEVSEVYLEEKEAINTEYEELLTEFDSLNEEFENLEQANEQLTASFDEQKKELEAKRAEVSRLLRKGKLTESELEKARAMIDELRADKQSLLTEINELKNQNLVLQEENQQVNESLAMVSEEKELLASKNDSLSSQNQQLVEEKKANANKVEFSQVIPVKQIVAEGVKFKNSGREKTTDNYKKVDKLAITFTIAENPVATAGNKEYIIRVINPDGTVIYDNQRGSGEFVSTENEGMKYTTKTMVDYDNTEKQVSTFWIQDRPYQEGTYLVEVYQNGYQVGETSFELDSGLF